MSETEGGEAPLENAADAPAEGSIEAVEGAEVHDVVAAAEAVSHSGVTPEEQHQADEIEQRSAINRCGLATPCPECTLATGALFVYVWRKR